MLIQDQIKDKLTARLSPIKLEIINDSHKHAGHMGDDGSGQTHFTVKIVSEQFANMNRIERHRSVMNILAPCFEAGLHALSLQAKTPEEI